MKNKDSENSKQENTDAQPKRDFNKLQASPGLINSVFNSVAVGICIIDEQAKFVELNKKFCKTFGYKKSELIGKKFTALVSEDKKHSLLDVHKALMQNHSHPKLILDLRNKKGKTLIVEATAELVEQPDTVKLLIVSVRDITQEFTAKRKLKKALSALKERNKEQTCLYKISKLGNENLHIEKLLYKAVEKLKPAFQHPEFTTAQISYKGRKYKTAKHKSSKWMLTASKEILNNQILEIEVSYHKETIDKDEVPFLEDEKQLIDSVTNNLVLIINQAIVKNELKKNRASLSNILNRSLDLICTINANGQFVDMSNASKKILGYDALELKGKTYLDIVYSEDVEKTKESTKLIIEGKEFTNFENRCQRKNGSLVPLIWSAKWDSNTQAMYCVAKDATEITKSNNNLIKSETKYRNLFNSGPIPMMIFELNSLEIIDVNNNAVEHYGYSKEEFLSMTIKDIRPKSEVPDLMNALDSFRATEGSRKFGIHKHQKKDGCIIQAEITGHSIFVDGKKCMIVLCNDVTQREKTLKALQESEARYKGFYDSQTNYVIRTDMEGNYSYFNKKFEEEFGWVYPDGKILGKNCFPSICEYHHEKVFQVVEKCIADPEKVFKVEIDKPSQDGGIVTTLWDFVCILDANKTPHEIQCMGIDITDLKHTEIKLKEKTKQLSALASIISLMLQIEDRNEALEACFQIAGSTIEADRIYFFEWNETDKTYSQIIEWNSEHTAAQLNNPELQNIPQEAYPEFFGTLYKGKPYQQIVSKIKPSPLKELLSAQDIKSLLVIPVKANGEFLGFVGFDDCNSERLWSDDEKAFLTSFSSDLAVLIQREKTFLQLQKAFDEKDAILESIGEAFFAMDNNWNINYINSIAEKMMQVDRKDILGQSLWDNFPDIKNKKIHQEYIKAIQEQKPRHFDEYYEEANTWVEISAYPSSDGLSVFFKDISFRKIAEKEIKASNERFRKVTQATQDAIWDYDLEKDSLFWGKGFSTLFGYQINKEKNIEDWKKCIHPEDLPSVMSKLDKVILNFKSNNWQSEYRFKKADGSYAYVIDRGVIIRNAKNNPIRMVGAMADITLRKEQEESLRKLNENLKKKTLELSDSNQELEQFAYVASHDLQEPLRMVSNFLTQLDKKYSDQLDEKAKRYIHFAVDGSKRMRKIILDLLEYSRVGKHDGELEEIEMGEFVQDILALLRKPIADKKAKIHFANLPTIKTYRPPLIQVFQNIIGNALKYVELGKIPEITIEHKELKKYWQFEIRDNGLGIEKEDASKIFIIFTRLHDREIYEGSGLGLAIVKKIIGKLGGKIWVESELDKGSSFFFTIKKY